MRRVVTGHNIDGKSIVAIDDNSKRVTDFLIILDARFMRYGQLKEILINLYWERIHFRYGPFYTYIRRNSFFD